MQISPVRRKSQRIPSRKQIPSILVICEDENIEPQYFNKLKEIFNNVVEIKVESAKKKTDPINIVNKAITKRVDYLRKRKIAPHAETWCVFDADNYNQPNKQSQVNEAVNLSLKNNINIALSNPCIEFWFLCYYTQSSSPYQNAKQVLQALKKCSHCSTYNKTLSDFLELQEFLNFVTDKENIKIAINNADKINKLHLSTYPNKYDLNRKPSTNINELINKIIEED